jgi:hypothetical protein
MSTLSRNEAALRGKVGAHVLHATRDPRETTANARRAFLHKFESLVDPDGKLPQEERQRRASAARKAHFARLALLSARARAKRGATPKASTTVMGSAHPAEEGAG